MKKISIIIAVFNVSKEYLNQCMESLLNQTMKDIEIILIDDGSEIECASACDAYAELDTRVIVKHKRNEGYSIAANLGIEMATGEYIAFVDNDDWVDYEMCQKAYDKITETKADVVLWTYYSYCKTECKPAYYKGENIVVYTGENIKKLQAQIIDPFAYAEQQISLAGSNWAKLYRADFLKQHKDVRFPEHMMGGEDAIFTFKALNYVRKAVFFHENLYYYRQNEQSYTKRWKPDMLKDELKMLHIYQELIGSNLLFLKCLNKATCNSLIDICMGYLFHKENPMGFFEKRSYLKQLLHMPEYERALRGVSSYNFKKAKTLCLKFAYWKWVDAVLLLIYIYVRKNEEQQFE